MSQLQASGLATGERRHVHRLAVIGHLRATGKAQTQRQRRLAALVERISLTLQTAKQHLAIAIGDLSPAISGVLHAYLASTGNRGAGRGCRCDPKDLYKKVRRGELKNFTGIDSPYEVPHTPDIHIETSKMTPEKAVDRIITVLTERGIIAKEF